MATAAELQTMIDNCEAAINQLLTSQAQSVSIAGRNWTALDLDKLNNFRRQLENELAQVTAGGGRPAVIRFTKPGGAF